MAPLLTDYLMRRRNELVSRYVRGEVLDIGCGMGTIIPFLDAGQRYVGIEISPEFVAYLSQRFPQWRFYNCNVDEEPLELGDQRFDTVLLVAVVEHLAHPEKVLADIQKVLRSGGSLIITTPTLWGQRVHRLGARLGFFHPHAAAGHVCAYGYAAMRNLVNGVGLEIVEYKRFELGFNQLFICQVTAS
jgi:2-polyprenyl-3-methyl-5-hydroxy-6-metoxy-1,4-benzoquinol methylase